MSAATETLVRFTAYGCWHAVPYGDSHNETKTLCGRSFCPNQVRRRTYSLNAWDACVTCRKMAEKEVAAS